MTKLQNDLECAFAGIGLHVGELVKCLVTQEINAKMQQIEQLQAILATGSVCAPSGVPEENSTA